MSADDAIIFIDSQQYTDLYRTKSGKKLLAPLNEQSNYIFITEQIVNEVNKHKLLEAIKFFRNQCQIDGVPGCELPDHLFDDSGATVENIRGKLKEASGNVKEATKALEEAVAKTLRDISRSEDVVSKALQPLFDSAVAHNPDELHRAEDRKTRGIPPGKQKDSLGDELNWEQFLSYVKSKGKKNVWIISRDGDYNAKWADQLMLTPILYQDLKKIDPAIEVHAFETIPEGIKHFANVTGVKADALPKQEVIEEIKKEQESLPPLDWQPSRYPSFRDYLNHQVYPHPKENLFKVMQALFSELTTPPTAVNAGSIVGIHSSEPARTVSLPEGAQPKK